MADAGSVLTPNQKAMAQKAGANVGLGKHDEADMKKWMARSDDVNRAVRYLLSGEGGDEVLEDGEDEQPPTPTKAVNRALRHSADYSRFDNDEFIATLEAQIDPAPKPKLRPKTVAKLTEQLMVEEAERYKDRGNAAYKKGDIQEAVEHYSSGLTLSKGDKAQVGGLVPMRNNRAAAYIKLEQWPEALEDCNFVLQEDPRNVKALHRRGTALLHLRRAKEACEDLRLALKYDGGGNPEVRKLLERANAERLEERKVKKISDPATLDVVSGMAAKLQRCIRRLRWTLRQTAPGAAGPLPPPIGGEVEAETAPEPEEGWEGEEGGVLALLDTLGSLQAVLMEEAAAIYFRWIEGIDTLVEFLDAVRTEIRTALTESVAAREGETMPSDVATAWAFLTTRLFDVMAVVFQSDYNLTCFIEDQRKKSGDFLILPFVVEVVEHRSLPLCSASGIRLLARLTQSPQVRGDLQPHLGFDRLLLFPHHTECGGDGALPSLLQLLDNLLQSQEWRAKCADVPLAELVLPLLSAKRSRACRDSAVGALLRLSASDKHRAQLATGKLKAVSPEVESRLGEHSWCWRSMACSQAKAGTAFRRIVKYLASEWEADGGQVFLRSPYAVEGLLAVLHNCTVADDPSIRQTVVDVLLGAGVCALCITLLRTGDGSAVTASDPLLNIKARALGVLSKCVGSAEGRREVLRHKDVPGLLVDYGVMVRGQNEEIPDITADTDDPLAASEGRLYQDACAEHAVCVAAALMRDRELEARSALVSTLLSVKGLAMLNKCARAEDDKTAGNAALSLGELVKEAEGPATLGESGSVDALLDLIQRKRAAIHDEDAHRRTKFREEGKGSEVAVEVAMRLNVQAQRNAAICLARLARDPANKHCLDQRKGLEILATTLKLMESPPAP